MGTMVIERWNGTEVRLTGIPLPRLITLVPESAQESLINTVFYWRDRFGPGHFRVEAHSRYGGREANVYEDRTAKHNRRKHNRRPLYMTGNLRLKFLGGAAMRVRATGSDRALRATATWSGLPAYTHFDKTKKGTQSHKKYLELTATNEEEERKLADFFARDWQRQFDEASE